jgi:hypothetical protein
MSKTDALENEVLRLVTGQATTIYNTTPIAPFVSLWTVAPSEAGTGGTEVTGGSYARVNASGKFATPSGGSVANNDVVTFNTATADWGVIVAFGIHAGASGTLIRVGTLSKTIQSGDTASFAAGALTLTED